MPHTPPHRRPAGYYWVKLNPTISDGWEVAHYSAAWRSWQIHGKTDNLEEGKDIIEVNEKQITQEDYEQYMVHK